MPVLQFQVPTRVVSGPDALGALSTLSGRRVLIITDAFMAAAPLMDQVRARLGDAEVSVFSEVHPDPDTHAVAAGVKAFLEFDPEALIGLGGGSPIDTAKAVRHMARQQGRELPAGFIIIPTTSGTGSEVTSFSVVTDPGTRTKVPLTDPSMIADVAILDPEAVRTCPPRLTADSGMDALSHAIEAVVAKGHNDLADALAEKAVRIVFRYLPRSYRDGDDLVARDHLQNAATMAGVAFQNAGLGIVHGISHSIGGSFHVAHGRLNAMIMPHVMAFNAGDLSIGGSMSEVAQRYYKLAFHAGMQATNERNLVLKLIRRVERLRDEIEMPARITEAGVDRREFLEAIPDLASAALADFCSSGNPVEPTREDIVAILRKLV
ncbi:1-propanol dehydrogenase PduQ [Propionibacterium australiense]|uniref:Iron-containing alcohol dehydrogenase n=1 Tax=Propionibacterium australiense TaxID=119981 RepID=A0A383S858_9ACTN|nr:1-propanol dehydrogenase PduQ [Propionibacterium australiense]RLP10953.1 iron-containing alcohol dehydrogenase [Propionibacterium australiense]RLP13080.1 iron-containing alcohol dehydrogenase [Propionibacterium australiense]SYZ33911.1 PDD [Propionibacterium australiense]VEH90932.1 NAD-dependent methanol dehydrogenase [Propionibacterium australiense]